MTKYSPNIIIDVDDTTLDFTPVWIGVYNIDYHDNLTKDKIKTWDIGKYTKIGKNFYNYLRMPNFNLYDGVLPIEGALEGIKFLKSKNYNIVFVTAFDYYNRKHDRLVELGFLNNNDKNQSKYIVSFDKNLIKARYIIDDNSKNVFSFDGDGLLYTQPWNEDCIYDNRVNNWQEIIKKFGG